MSVGEDLAAETHRVVLEEGEAITLTREIAGTYDEATGTATVASPEYGAFAIVTAFKDSLVNGTSILKSDRKCKISALSLPAGIEPQLADRVTTSEGLFSILDPGRVVSCGVLVAFVAHIRKSG
jgi:hypothetical protein